MQPDNTPDIQIHQVSFRPDGIVEITYTEAHDQAPSIQIVKNMMFEARKQESHVNQLLEDIAEVVDEVLMALRDDPATIPGSIRR